jgi:hypothetical protein
MILAASAAPPRAVAGVEDVRVTSRTRMRSSSSSASCVTVSSVATRWITAGCASMGSSCSTSAAIGGSRCASTSAAICGCSCSISAAIVFASIQRSASSARLSVGGVIRARTVSARSGPSARSITFRIRGAAPKPIVVRCLARPTNWSNTFSTCTSLTSATLNIAAPRC